MYCTESQNLAGILTCALFKPALQAVIVRGVAGAQWGERGAAMGYGLPAPGSRLSAPWRLGDAGAQCVCVLDRVSMRLAVQMPPALCVQTR